MSDWIKQSGAGWLTALIACGGVIFQSGMLSARVNYLESSTKEERQEVILLRESELNLKRDMADLRDAATKHHGEAFSAILDIQDKVNDIIKKDKP